MICWTVVAQCKYLTHYMLTTVYIKKHSDKAYISKLSFHIPLSRH